MKFALFALGVVVAASAMGGRAEAQNYPWCAYWHGTGGVAELRLHQLRAMHVDRSRRRRRLPGQYGIQSA